VELSIGSVVMDNLQKWSVPSVELGITTLDEIYRQSKTIRSTSTDRFTDVRIGGKKIEKIQPSA